MNDIILHKHYQRWYVFISLALLCLSFTGTYHKNMVNIFKGWFTEEGSYGLLILAISIYLIWSSRKVLTRLPLKPNILWGSLFSIVGGILYIIAELTFTMLIEEVSLVLILLGLIWLALGTAFFKTLFIPVVYLLMMLSFFEELLGNFSIHFQLTSAWLAALILEFAGVPVLLTGKFIELPHITLEVARICSGIQHIIALVALSVPLAVITQKTWIRKIVYIVVAFIIGVFSNALRVALIGFWTMFKGSSASIHGPLEVFYVSFIVIFGLILLFLTSSFSRSKNPKREDAKNKKITEPNTVKPRVQIRPFLISSAIALTLLLIINWIPSFLNIRPSHLSVPLAAFPKVIGKWNGEDVNKPDWPVRFLSADDQLKRIYSDPLKNKIGLYIGYFASQKQDKELINDLFNWLHYDAELIPIKIGSKTIHIKKRKSPQKNNPVTYYFWYEINGEVLTGRYKSKLATLYNSLLNSKNNGVQVIITIDHNENRNKNISAAGKKFISAIVAATKTQLNSQLKGTVSQIPAPN